MASVLEAMSTEPRRVSFELRFALPVGFAHSTSLSNVSHMLTKSLLLGAMGPAALERVSNIGISCFLD